MSKRYLQWAVALIVPVGLLAVGHWLDRDVLGYLVQRSGSTLDPRGEASGFAVAHLVAGGAAIAVFVALWWSRSVGLALLYVLGGGFLVLLPPLAAALAIGVNGAAPIAPEPIATFLADAWLGGIGSGVTGLAMTVGGAMVVSGVVVIGANLRLGVAVAAPAVERPE